MSIRGFLRALFGSPPPGSGRAHHAGDDLADRVRETMGPQSGGAFGGRMTGNAVYHLLEDEVEADADV